MFFHFVPFFKNRKEDNLKGPMNKMPALFVDGIFVLKYTYYGVVINGCFLQHTRFFIVF